MAVEKVGGWICQQSEVVYDNPWIEVRHDTVTTPKGTPGIYGVVHFKGIAVGVVPVDESGYTWLVKQSRYALGQFTWEVPEGGSPEGESTIDTAHRELAEEVGLQAEWLEHLQTLHLSNSVTDERAELYLATGLTFTKTAHEDTEDIEVLRLPLQEAIGMARSGEITDVMSVSALLALALKISEEGEFWLPER